MKKVIAMLIVLALCAGIPFALAQGEGTSEQAQMESVLQTEYVKVDGCFVDSSYQMEDGSPKKMVYLFLTISAFDQNLRVDSCDVRMQIGKNQYTSSLEKRACRFTPAYYYKNYIEDIYVGEELKLALTFKVPKGDLTAGKEILLADNAIPLSGLRIFTDDLVFCDSPIEIGEQMDPEGCAEAVYMCTTADEATRNKVRKEINGYYISSYVQYGTQIVTFEVAFEAPNKFELTTSLGSRSGGTYEVQNGYLVCTYSNTGKSIDIPYGFEDGEIWLDANKALSIYE